MSPTYTASRVPTNDTFMYTDRKTMLFGASMMFCAALCGAFGGGLVGRRSNVSEKQNAVFQQTLRFDSSASPSFSVPEGKRAVVTYIGAKVIAPSGQQALLTIKSTLSGKTAEFPLVLARPIPNQNGTDLQILSQPISIFGDPLTEISVNATLPGGKSFNGWASLSGYFVDQ
jgi:hypothetical protein